MKTLEMAWRNSRSLSGRQTENQVWEKTVYLVLEQTRFEVLRCLRNIQIGTFLVAQWLRSHASNARGAGVISGQGTKIPHATRSGQREEKNFQTNMSKQTAGHIDIKPTRIWELKLSLEDH